MLDLKLLRQTPEEVATRLRTKGFAFDVAQFQALDGERKRADTESQELQAQRNQAAKRVGELIKSGMSVDAAKASVEATLQAIDARREAALQAAREAQQALDALLLAMPNLPDGEVPAGSGEADNLEVSRWGEPPNFDFSVKDHVDLGQQLGGLDFDAAARMTGSRFMVLRGPLARLHRALIQFMLDLHIGKHGYSEVYVPYLVNADSLHGTGQLPKFEEELFKLAGEQAYYLIPTAEVPVTNLHRESIVEPAELGDGLRYVCHTPCFRSEAGSYGRDTRGLIRQHQFEKVELVQLVPAACAEAALQSLTGHAEAVLQALGLPYRKMLLCGGDMGFAASRTYDLEVWLPAQQRYREISSCSHFGEFQARRMQARWRNPESGKPEYLHTLNGSALAVGRTLVAILENGQQRDGTVVIPPGLVPYMGGLDRLG